MERYGFPSQQNYCTLERETIKRLRMLHLLYRNEYSSAREKLEELFNKLGSKKKPLDNILFEFPFETTLEKGCKEQRILLHGEIRFEKGRLQSDSFAIEIFGVKGTKEEGEVIRRIHFDIAIPYVEENKDEHPLYHVQLAGKSRELMSKELQTQKQFSFPRIPFVPMSIALFFDMAVRELGPRELKDWIKLHPWRSLIRKNEKTMLRPFFVHLHKQWRLNSQFIVSDLYYGTGD